MLEMCIFYLPQIFCKETRYLISYYCVNCRPSVTDFIVHISDLSLRRPCWQQVVSHLNRRRGQILCLPAWLTAIRWKPSYD